jgi:CRISPR-associated exonuclease Cas4
MELPDYLPLSYLNQLLYCERRFWYMYVLGELAVNAALLDGTLRHQRVDRPGYAALDRADAGGGRPAEGPDDADRDPADEPIDAEEPPGAAQPAWQGSQPAVAVRRVTVYLERLRINGICDLVEERGGTLRPVEYKHGKQGRWNNDQVQLCAQALCLEERTGRPVADGEIYYYRSRHRVEVPFTQVLRAETEAAVQRAWALLEAGNLPAHTRQRAHCDECSLEPICLPREVQRLLEDQGSRPCDAER